jgi:hypothetical protein
MMFEMMSCIDPPSQPPSPSGTSTSRVTTVGLLGDVRLLILGWNLCCQVRIERVFAGTSSPAKSRASAR